ncbi:protein FAR1-RELATED SEQUENCE 5-like [Lotus japonicus]|uniref:protein FAR1-RELATED SEQUENCE 5-like n=1 Tax=Lotus japonicus TaxID=34305 RepID=UPI00258672FB|nr:protein FAR1-RELATED SEQUENCE 5-like [Lotus japonicus]
MSFPESYEVDMHGEKVPENKVKDRQLANVNASDDVSIAANYTEQFTTDRVFVTQDELMDWVKAVGKQLGFVIIIRRSDCGSKGRGSKSRQLAILGCEMGGKLKARRTSEDGLWRLTGLRGDHNHKLAENLHDHACVGRITSEEKDMLGKMVDKMVKPGNMLLALKSANPQNLTTIRQVYNERMTHMRALIEIQHLMRLLEEDSTYKTNKYRIPLLEMVGMTSIGFTYTIAFGYTCNEREAEVTWTLQKLRGLILREEDMSKVIITDRDQALMNAVEATFPTTTHLLCQFHISMCMKEKCKLTIQPKEMWDDVGDA